MPMTTKPETEAANLETTLSENHDQPHRSLVEFVRLHTVLILESVQFDSYSVATVSEWSTERRGRSQVRDNRLRRISVRRENSLPTSRLTKPTLQNKSTRFVAVCSVQLNLRLFVCRTPLLRSRRQREITEPSRRKRARERERRWTMKTNRKQMSWNIKLT